MTKRCDFCGNGIYGEVYSSISTLYWHTSCYQQFLFYFVLGDMKGYEANKKKYFDKLKED